MHRFGAALRQWAAGVLTRQQIIDGFQLSGDDITQLDALRATYDGMLTGNAAAIGAKVAWLDRMEDVFLLCETGDYDEAKARAHSDSDGSEFRDRLVQRHHRDPWQHGQRDGLDFEPKVVIFWWNGRTASTDGIGAREPLPGDVVGDGRIEPRHAAGRAV